jgi:16S rRNA (cytidine1402-2'-O)-methyltransferase
MEIFIVGTPIGNLDDISKRAIDILSQVDLILAEDTRVTAKLLKRFEINTKIISCNEFNEFQRLEYLSKEKKFFKKIALVSDAGTPLISDPGKKIVEYAYKNNFKLIPVPGASAITTILSVVPFDIRPFVFLGFVEKVLKLKRECFKNIINLKYPFIFFESPKRILNTLKILKDIDDTVEVVVGRELTKIYEQVIFGKISDVLEILSQSTVKGEFVVVVSKSNKIEQENFEYMEDVKILKNLKMSTKDIAYFISTKYNIKKNLIYNYIKNLE